MIPLHATAPTGTLTLSARVRRDADGFFIDFADGVFKAAGHATPSLALTEPDPVAFPGLFRASLAPEGPPIWTDGRYVAFVRDSAGALEFDPTPVLVRDARALEGDAMDVTGLAALASLTGDVTLIAWLLADARLYLGAGTLSASLYSDAGVLLSGPLADAAPDGQGIYKVTFVAPIIPTDAAVYVVATITVGGTAYRGVVPFVVYDL